MKILVINAGSSSLKYQLIDMKGEIVLAKGLYERIGIGGKMSHKTSDGRKVERDIDLPTHTEAFMDLTKVLTTGDAAVISDLNEITAIGHRVVQGSEKFNSSTLITKDVIDAVVDCYELAPLHNPANVLAINACISVFGDKVPQVAVFDTAFHQTMPQKAYMFGIPHEYYEKYRIRRYGFHGTSHRFVSGRWGELNGGLEGTKLITCHMGNGSSITAIKDGKSVDTSMGFTPLDGIIMGTRSGGIDPSIVTFLQQKENLSAKEVDDLLNKSSGFRGVSMLSSDARDLQSAADSGDCNAQLTIELVCYQVKKFIGSYAAAMGGLDAVIFTGGMGENSIPMRKKICEDMEFLGIKLDDKLNVEFSGKEKDISAPDAKTRVWIIPTNEELMIARDTKEVLSKMK